MSLAKQSWQLGATKMTKWIGPTHPQADSTIDLSTIDQVTVRCWSSYVLCFNMPEDRSPEGLFDLLSANLQSTIDQFPFIMGSIASVQDSNSKEGSLEIRIKSTSAVQFVFKDATQSCSIAFEDLQDSQFAPSIMESQELLMAPSIEEVCKASHNPVFVAQATFIRGGVLLFFAHSHQIADVTGTGAMMRCWSENMTAAASGRSLHVSSQLREASIGMNLVRLNGIVSDEPVPYQSYFPMVIENTPPPSPQQTPKDVFRQNPSLIWYTDVTKLEDLKEFAKPGVDEEYISTLDAVNALFWRAICRARKFDEERATESTMFFMVDIRSRLSPALRSDSVLNAGMKLFTTRSWSQILDQDLQSSLSKAASGIRGAILTFSPSQFEEWVAYVNSAPSFWSLKNMERLEFGPDIVVTDHSKVSTYKHT